MNRNIKIPVPNKERLEAVLEQINKHPKTWIQSDWHCGSSHCFMGWAQVMSGKRPDDDKALADGAKWLGLTHTEALQLSCAGNSRADLRKIVKQILRNKDNLCARLGVRVCLNSEGLLDVGDSSY